MTADVGWPQALQAAGSGPACLTACLGSREGRVPLKLKQALAAPCAIRISTKNLAFDRKCTFLQL